MKNGFVGCARETWNGLIGHQRVWNAISSCAKGALPLIVFQNARFARTKKKKKAILVISILRKNVIITAYARAAWDTATNARSTFTPTVAVRLTKSAAMDSTELKWKSSEPKSILTTWITE